jgi:hypothetical protein
VGFLIILSWAKDMIVRFYGARLAGRILGARDDRSKTGNYSGRGFTDEQNNAV